MLSGVSFIGKHNTKANGTLWQKGQFKPKKSSSSPFTPHVGTKGSSSPNTPMVAEHLQLDWMTSALIAQPTHVYDSNFISSFYQCFCWTTKISKHVTEVFMVVIRF